MGLVEGKVIIVTGASSGIGEKTAEVLAAEGAKVVLAARRKEKLEDVANRIIAAGGEAYTVSGDVSVREDCDRIAEETVKKYGRIDVLVNNAGITKDNLMLKMTEEDFEETLEVVRKVRYDSAFTFIYSKRTGTPAAAMENQVPEEVVKERFDRLLAEVQAISAQVCGRDVHTVQEVLVEEPDSHVEGLVTGRMSNNTIVHFPGGKELIGKIVKVYLEESKGFYYMGSLVD